jgi:Mn-dependent DtxR family transcriptional regulator
MDYPRSIRIVYATLIQSDLSEPIPAAKIAEKIEYSPITVQLAINKLHKDGLITCHRRREGLPYLYKLS